MNGTALIRSLLLTVILLVYFTAVTLAQNVNRTVVEHTHNESTTSHKPVSPLFRGLRGQSFSVPGADQTVYNLLTDWDVQVNARFVRRSEGACPQTLIDTDIGCFTGAGTYISQIGIKTSGGDRIAVDSGAAEDGFESVTVNSMYSPPVNATIPLSYHVRSINTGGFIVRNSSHTITLRLGQFELVITNSDRFINVQKLSANYWSRLSSHGLLGQTWRHKKYTNNKIPVIQGELEDYILSDNDLMSDNFVFNRFSTLCANGDHMIDNAE